MNTIVKPIPHTVDLNEPVKKTYIDTLLATEDNLAHRFDITLKQGVPSGAAVTAYFIRYSDNATISMTGTVSGNVASVTLNKSCYNKAGQYAIIIKLVADGVTNTVFYGEGTIFTSMTDTILDPENVVPSLSDLLAQIAVMEEATAATKAATTNAKTATTRANNAAAKIEGMTASAVNAETAGVTVSEVNGVKHFAFELPKGPKGDPGTIENVTITSINGLPEALAGKLGKTETAADSAKLGGKAPEYYLQPLNLLDNSDFRNPVNQRGFNTCTTAWTVTIDRWWSGSVNTALTDDGVKVIEGGWFYQNLDYKLYQKYLANGWTAAVWLADGTLTILNSAGLYIKSGGCFVEIVTENAASGYFTFRISASWEHTPVVKCCALYPGVYTADNLPPYVPKENEIVSCLKYAKKVKLAYNTFLALSTAAGYAAIELAVPMRIDNPSITVENVGTIRGGGATIEPTNISISTANQGQVIIRAEGSFAANTVYEWIDFSAMISADM